SGRSHRAVRATAQSRIADTEWAHTEPGPLQPIAKAPGVAYVVLLIVLSCPFYGVTPNWAYRSERTGTGLAAAVNSGLAAAEPAATAALNFGTPRRRSSLKRLGPFCHCRQRYERNLRRIQASKFVSTRGVWQKPK